MNSLRSAYLTLGLLLTNISPSFASPQYCPTKTYQKSLTAGAGTLTFYSNSNQNLCMQSFTHRWLGFVRRGILKSYRSLMQQGQITQAEFLQLSNIIDYSFQDAQSVDLILQYLPEKDHALFTLIKENKDKTKTQYPIGLSKKAARAILCETARDQAKTTSFLGDICNKS